MLTIQLDSLSNPVDPMLKNVSCYIRKYGRYHFKNVVRLSALALLLPNSKRSSDNTSILNAYNIFIAMTYKQDGKSNTISKNFAHLPSYMYI